jgi:Kyakuja-Dileera-Zisupton transposase
MNTDYSVCKAAEYNSSDGFRLLQILLIYDIVCQWWIHFRERVKNSGTLSFSEFRALIVAVGKFHLGSHIKPCFWKFSLNFIPGVGQIDGEIMETLWALFNKFARMTRSMTKAHRADILRSYHSPTYSDWSPIGVLGV